ncbi:hypothetical protein PAXRUDRAFT_832238 [Paxillus rubicundulus Ve08.2h10]|uniref:F-box domain-containing protein n=1 Tax=Paxillus rubicundulus Ve08.2h10 TaxID=930991 RepID=A0A0D0DDI9_9AGAM|nr:hypothetical protein PAXRUDRAFT_832238 [Paxillus rubicundulus Ve08.2h10]
MLPTLPDELLREIVLLSARSLQEACYLLVVAKRVHMWTEGLVYSDVALHTERQAHLFLSSLYPRPQFALRAVKSLRVDRNVQLYTAVQVLQICQGLTQLVLHALPLFPGCSSALLDALDGLPLISLSIYLSLLYNTTTVSLPALSVFRRVVDLEICDGWVLWGSTLHLERLQQLTHLIVRFSTQRTQPAFIRLILHNCESLQVITLRTNEAPDVVHDFLQRANLLDRRIVILGE